MRQISGNPNLLEQRESVLEDLEYHEPTKEELIADFKQAWREAQAGGGRDALEVLDEIDREIDG